MTTNLDPKQQQQITDDATKAATDAATTSATTAATTAAETKAASAAKSEVEGQLKTAFGVTTVSLDEISKKLKTKMLDDVVELEGKDEKRWPQALVPLSNIMVHTHRYTVDVPDEDEQSVLNMGHGDKGRQLPDAGISARTTSHIHLHTMYPDHSSFLVLGGPTKASPETLLDPKSVLGANHGISAITNGHLWAEAQGQLNLASYENQAVLRAHKDRVRVQADVANVEVGSGKNVVLGGAENVDIVANSDMNPGDNAYKKGFDHALVDKSAAIGAKDAVTAMDIFTACQSVIGAIKTQDSIYTKGKVAREDKKNDAGKTITDGAKALSSIGRFLAGKLVNGQIKISAQSFASVYGMVGASVYGHLSASLTSALSASVVGATASVKGLKYASVWAGHGVSLRTKTGSASLKSDDGKVSINGKEEVSVVSAAGLNMGGDSFAELKSLSGHVYVAAPETKICAGDGSGTAVLLSGGGAYFGTVSNANEASCAPKHGAFVKIADGPNNRRGETPKALSIEADGIVSIKSRGSFMTFKNNEVSFKGKKANIL